jgi:hypothetical protein
VSQDEGEGTEAAKGNHWLFMFRPETYELVKKHETLGVLKSHRARFSTLAPSDRFVSYVSRLQILDGHGVVESSPFESTESIFGDRSERYPHRAKVSFVETGLGRDGSKLLYGLSAFQEGLNTTPANTVLCKGGFLEITQEDYEWLVGCMRGTIQPEWEQQDA